MESTTATSAPGINLTRFLIKGLSQTIMTMMEMMQISNTPASICFNGVNNSCKVFIAKRKQFGEVSFFIPIIAHGMRDLFGNDEDADAGQHSFDHTRRKIISDPAKFGKAHSQLQQCRR